MFKIGDRVRIKRCIEDNKIFNGETGTIKYIDCDTFVTVEFDKFIDGHFDEYYGKKGHCWCVGLENLELLDKEVKNKTKICTHKNVKKVIVNEPAVIVILNDGTKGVSKVLQGDVFDEEIGYKLSYNKCKIKQLKKQIKMYEDKIKQVGGR